MIRIAARSRTLPKPEHWLTKTEFDQPPHAGPVRSYVICSTPRSGSTLLGELLRGTGCMGVPGEYLENPVVVAPMGARLGALGADGILDMTAYLAALRRVRTTSNGVFGLKAHFHQLRPVLHLDCVRQLLRGSRLVWIRRRDLLAQAISEELAQQTQQWMRLRGTASEPRIADFSYQVILGRMRRIKQRNMEWQAIFQADRLSPIKVDYEALLADCDAVCRAIAASLEVVPPHGFSLDAVALLPQRDALNDEWRARFLQAHRVRAGALAAS